MAGSRPTAAAYFFFAAFFAAFFLAAFLAGICFIPLSVGVIRRRPAPRVTGEKSGEGDRHPPSTPRRNYFFFAVFFAAFFAAFFLAAICQSPLSVQGWTLAPPLFNIWIDERLRILRVG